MSKLRVVWLCHFVNDQLNQRYCTNKQERAPWMDLFFNLMSECPAIDIHVIAPNLCSNKDDKFIENGITFHLYRYYPGLLPSKWANLYLALTLGIGYRNKIKFIVKKIKPDLIHLFGSENLDYSSGVLPLVDEYPILVSIQGEISNAKIKGNIVSRIFMQSQIHNERKINNKLRYFTLIDDENWKQSFKHKYPAAKIFDMYFPTKIPSCMDVHVEKKYDFVFYGRVSYFKGIEDLIAAIAIVKKDKKDVSLLVIGRINSLYKAQLNQLIKKNELEDNITFIGFLKSQEDVFRHALQAQIYVLPTHFDGLPGTVRECMYLKIPVITYPVGALPVFNKKRTSLLFAKYKEISDLATQMLFLLNNKLYREKLVRNAYITVTEEFSNDNITSILPNIYTDVLKCGQ